MNYTETLNYIHSLERFGVKPGLERISELCKKSGNPQKDLKIIHVAGTNGKGSTSTMIANMLMCAGFKVGLFISPYVTDFRERIQINGEMIDRQSLIESVVTIKNIREDGDIPATEFEVITAAAFLCFKKHKCDYVVLEVGLGGRFDATNIIESPQACVIASVSFDHQSVLGDTIEKIAFEKCGIIKDGSPVISYPLQNSEALSVIEKTCVDKNSELIIPDIDALSFKNSDLLGNTAVYKNIDFSLNLPGKHMVYNAITAIEAVKCVLPNITNEQIKNGLKNTVMPARLEILSNSPLVIMDGGHNEECAIALRNYLSENLKNKEILAVCSMMADKDYDKYLAEVLPFVKKIIICRVNMERSLACNELCNAAEKYCKETQIIPSTSDAVLYALKQADSFDAIIICGSFYLAGEVRQIIREALK